MESLTVRQQRDATVAAPPYPGLRYPRSGDWQLCSSAALLTGYKRSRL